MTYNHAGMEFNDLKSRRQVLLVQYKHDLLEDADSAMVVVMSELVQLQETEMAVMMAQILVKVQLPANKSSIESGISVISP